MVRWHLGVIGGNGEDPPRETVRFRDPVLAFGYVGHGAPAVPGHPGRIGREFSLEGSSVRPDKHARIGLQVGFQEGDLGTAAVDGHRQEGRKAGPVGQFLVGVVVLESHGIGRLRRGGIGKPAASVARETDVDGLVLDTYFPGSEETVGDALVGSAPFHGPAVTVVDAEGVVDKPEGRFAVEGRFNRFDDALDCLGATDLVSEPDGGPVCERQRRYGVLYKDFVRIAECVPVAVDGDGKMSVRGVEDKRLGRGQDCGQQTAHQGYQFSHVDVLLRFHAKITNARVNECNWNPIILVKSSKKWTIVQFLKKRCNFAT